MLSLIPEAPQAPWGLLRRIGMGVRPLNLELETDRLILRPLVEADLDIAVTLWSDPEVTRFVAERAYSEVEIAEEMPMVIRRCAKGAIGIWCVTLKDTGEKLGEAFLLPLAVETDDTDCSLIQGDALPEAEVEIGYVYKRTAWGKGYASEACKRLLRFAFEDTPIKEIVAVTDPDNHASSHVLRKSGLTPVGTIHAYAEDLSGYRLSALEWCALQAGKGSLSG